MESTTKQVAEEGQWDLLRLEDVRSGRASHGTDYAHRVMAAISSYILQCKCVKQLLPYLEKRGVVASKIRSLILSQSEGEAASNLSKFLNARSCEQGNQRDIIEGIYLALLDCYEESGNAWCHGMAVSGLGPAVRLELKLDDVNFYDLAVMVQRVPSTNLPAADAARLTDELGLSSYGTLTDLKKIIQIAFSTRVSFHKLVSALLLTRNTGRYLSLLLPYCYCNPPWMYEVLQTLGQNWVTLAVYLGYSEVEIGAITRAGGEDPHHQTQMFMRVWWMPDCGTEETASLLNQLVHNTLKIVNDPIHVQISHWDKGLALLKACLDNDWGEAEALIKAGSFLGARSDDGRTPLMLACIRGKEKIVNLLIDYGADVQAVDVRGEACLNYTETLRNRAILERILREYQKLRISVDVESLVTGYSPLSTACKCGAVASAELLLKYGANPNGCENGRHRPLVEASAQGHVGLVNMLLRYRADIDATGKLQNGYTALLQACTSNHWGVAQVLMNEGADVNKCVASDCTSPLFIAVTANEYRIASELIKKGASVNAMRFQPGAVEGTVEVTPLSQAAGKGLNAMVTLLLNNGANINYLCSDTLPAIAFAILGDRIDTFHLLLDSPNLVKTLAGLTPVIVTSVRTEKYYYTEKLLELFGGPQVALLQAQNDRMDILVENIMMYMQAVNHPELAEVGSMQQELMAPASRQMRLGAGDQDKINAVLTDFSRICMSAILNNPDIQPESLIEGAEATGNAPVAIFLRQKLSGSMSDQELRQNFLLGDHSPLRFFIENNILTMEVFVVEVFKFRPDDYDAFYKHLVWTFQHMSGGADLPSTVDSMLKQLFSGRFTPRTSPQAGTQSGTETYHKLKEPVEPLHHQQPASEPSYDSRTRMEKDMLANLKETPLPEHKTSDDGKGNPTLPEVKSTGVRKAVENVENNTRLSQSHTDDPPFGAPFSMDGRGMHITDTARPRVVSGVEVEGINTKLGGPEEYDTPVTLPTHQAPQSSPISESAGISTDDGPSPASVDSHAPESAVAATGGSGASPTSKNAGVDYLPNALVHPTGVVLGQGAYGDVLEVEYKGVVYAAKKYRMASFGNATLGAFSREHDILARIRHPNVVPYYGICKLATDKSTVIVMERMEKNVLTLLNEKADIALAVKLKLLTDVASGLQHLHEQTPAIIHRDLTAGNVLLNSEGVAKISDFGNSRMVDLRATPEILTSNPGTLDYMPPEALEGGNYTVKLDNFSFGHLAIHIILQHRPHPLLRHTYKIDGKLTPRTEVERRELYLNEVKSKLRCDETHSLYTLIINCLSDDPDSRPSVKNALECIQKLEEYQN